MANKKVLFVVAFEGCEPTEYHAPKKVLEDVGFTVVTASNMGGVALAKDGSTTPVDVVLENINLDDYDGLFFIGGPGAMDHLDNTTSYALIKKAADHGMPLGAICHSARILAKSGSLEGRSATGWDGDNQLSKLFEERGVHYIRQDVVQDDTIVTATDPQAAQQWGEQIVTLLQGQS